MVHMLSDKCPWLEILAKKDHVPLRYPINTSIFQLFSEKSVLPTIAVLYEQK